MKISRFFGKDMREALALVSQEFGPDAVVLSTKRVDGGIEVVAANDYDEQYVRAKAALDDARRQDERKKAPDAKKSAGSADKSPAASLNEAARSAPDTVSLSSSGKAATAAAAPETQADGLRAAFAAVPAAPALPPMQNRETEIAVNELREEMREEMRQLRGLLEDQLTGLAWGDMRRRTPQKAMLLERLARIGLAPSIAGRIAENLDYQERFEDSWQAALTRLSQCIGVTNDDILTHGGVVALLGTTGVGKTTTIAKLAARYALAHGAENVALITTDCYRIAAHEQLRTFGQILGCPSKLVDTPEGLQKAIEQFAHKRLVLIDTAGTGQRDQQLGERLALLAAQGQAVRNYLVLSATAQRNLLDESIRAFGQLPLAGCVVTKLDEAGSLGDLLSVLVQHGLSVAYAADGQRVPEDLKIARSVNLVNQAIALAKNHAEEQDAWQMARYARPAGKG